MLARAWTWLVKRLRNRSDPDAARLFRLRKLSHMSRQRNEALVRSMCANAYLGERTSVCRVLGRYLMFVDTRDRGFSTHMLLNGYWELWVTEAMVKRLRAGMHAVDCGANLGYFTLIMADLVGPSGRVDAFEPNPAIAEKLLKSVDVNGFLDRTTVHRQALSDTAGEAVLHIPPADPKNAYLGSHKVRPDDVSVTIPTMRLDDLPNAATVDLIKIDVEGAEESLWAGMQGILSSGRPLTVILEFAAARYSDPAAFLERILSQGFTCELIDEDAGVVPATPASILSRPAHLDQMLVFSR